MQQQFRALPSVDRVLSDPRVQERALGWRPDLVTTLVRERLDAARHTISQGGVAPTLDAFTEAVLDDLAQLERGTLRRVINATGVVLHTNLGRAPLSRAAIEAMTAAAAEYSNLEFNLADGERGSRHVHIQGIVQRLTGAEDALVVNNNASAVLLGLSALARGREVIVSRGEEVEIGGGFRIPDVLRQSGATLVEVGTTNRTRTADYATATTEQTAAWLRVHASNFKIIGFTEKPELAELAAAARARKVVILDDLGSGCFVDTGQFGLDHESTVQESLAGGADLVFFSGDKLLGGPQAGIVAGRAELVGQLRRHPLARAVRIDKLSMAALAATLLHYLRGEAFTEVPIWRMISAKHDALAARAQVWASAIGLAASVQAGESFVGGGSLPGTSLRTALVAIAPGGSESAGAAARRLSDRLRLGDPAVVGRIEHDHLLLDPRTVLPEQDRELLHRVTLEINALAR